ncbi:glycosyl-4,4'-diaponeurosporenoate acyltransferase CrtO family protein [Cohnella abietis]|uniref:Glycosyl-4,4'-diaponeurosporenoate acyltransferase n=1 Tax=Cohnella abietis TaxID=2507935 RepID=A0A3T1D6E4_9BACL|nr:glycosyl-4,4'-diaponeurosporenoate acyltransferase [Cohnella abietis]BBI33629.1 glycosyl-4,4'-diaponeurosporenoate acyltransferase [Cohnella abietis]
MNLWTTVWTITANVLGVLIIHLGIAYACYRMPDYWFVKRHPSSYQQLTAKDSLREERFYDRVLKIRKWKDRLPEGSKLFRQAFDKSKLQHKTAVHYRQFILETRRAEWTHSLSILPAPLFLIWNNAIGSGLMIAYSLIANIPFILIQRYNRFRLNRILSHLEGKERA